MPARRKTASELRSARWFAPDDLRAFGHRSRFMQMGYGPEDWVGRPVVAIVNTWSDINPCHAHFKHRVEDIKHGILQAGGLPSIATCWPWMWRSCCAAIPSMARC